MAEQKKAVEKAAACCGGPAKEPADACCVRDADAKAAGEAGCGCGVQQGAQGRAGVSSSCCA